MYDWSLLFVVWFIGYWFGYSDGYKFAEQKYREYLRNKYNDNYS